MLRRAAIKASRQFSTSAYRSVHKHNVNPSEFDQLLAKKGQVVVDFKAEWCGPCKMLSPILERAIPSSSNSTDLITVDTDDQPDLAARFKVAAMPTVVAVKDGQEVARFVGARPDVQQWLAKIGFSV